MNNRHFFAGYMTEAGGMTFRVREGGKAAGDLVIEWFTSSGEWQAVPMDALFLLVDFLASNEDVLFPHPGSGGEYLMKRLRVARSRGWQTASAQLNQERQQAAQERTRRGEVA